MTEPEVIAQWPQPITVGDSPTPITDARVALEELERELKRARIGLIGTLAALVGTRANHRHLVEEVHHVNAICGTEGVTVTGGFAKWQTVGRRQRIGVSVLEGYDPYTITVPLIFDSLGDPKGVEDEIEVLEWMAGRGRLFRGRPGHSGEGETPLLQIYAASGSKLVPPECTTKDIRFVVTNIEFNTCGRDWIQPIREPNGIRIRQAVTVTLTQYESGGGRGLDSPANRAQVAGKQKHEYRTFTVGDGVNTFRKIAAKLNTNPNRIGPAAREIADANPKLGASVDKRLNRGTRVRYPLSATDLHQ